MIESEIMAEMDMEKAYYVKWGVIYSGNTIHYRYVKIIDLFFSTFSMCVVCFSSLVIFLYWLLIGGFVIKLLFGTFSLKLLFGMFFIRVIALYWVHLSIIVVFSFEAEFIQRLLQYMGNILPESLIISCFDYLSRTLPFSKCFVFLLIRHFSECLWVWTVWCQAFLRRMIFLSVGVTSDISESHGWPLYFLPRL